MPKIKVLMMKEGDAKEEWGDECIPLTVEVCLPEASRTGPSQVTSKKLCQMSIESVALMLITYVLMAMLFVVAWKALDDL
jgi:hypothetical protein